MERGLGSLGTQIGFQDPEKQLTQRGNILFSMDPSVYSANYPSLATRPS